MDATRGGPTGGRRDFMLDLGLGGFALGASACTHGERSSKQGTPSGASEGKQSLGVALVGLGIYSTQQLAPALQMTEHCHLAGIVTGSPDKVPVWRERYGIPAENVYDYETMHRIAENDAIDVIYVVVPTGLHAKYAVLAAETGKHVWCEKPMAMTVEECERIIAACRERGVYLSIGYRMQHEPNTRTVIEYAEARPYGAIKDVKALAGYRGGGGTGWRFQRDLGGGALYDMGVYSINGIRYATGEEPIAVKRARQFSERPELFTEVDETTEFELEFASGITAYGRTSVGENINHLRVECENGWYELEPMQAYEGVQGRTSDGKRLDRAVHDQQAQQMDDDALAILRGEPVMVPGEEGLRDIRIVQAIIESARSETRVPL